MFFAPLSEMEKVVRDNLGLAPTSRPKDHYIWLFASQTSLGTLYSSALLGRTLPEVLWVPI